MQVNRYLKDPAMDHIDHALGRPCDPMAETTRNYFESGTVLMFEDNPHWERLGSKFGAVWWGVTDAGRKALKAHLVEIGDKHRMFTVTHDGVDLQPEPATSHSAAKYAAWLSISDCRSALTFGDFVKTVSVRLTTSGVE